MILKIEYDLMTPGQQYGRIIAYIKGHRQWARPLASSWLIAAYKTAEEVRNDLLRLIDPNDKVLVTDVTGDAMAWHGLAADVTQWIHSTAPAYA